MTAQYWVRLSRNRNLPVVIAVMMALAVYAAHYLSYGPVPGNESYNPLGWFIWLDQGYYLEASQNFWTGMLRPEAQIYPPLYPALGALMLPVTDLHSYLLPNLLLFVIYVWAFMTAFGAYLGRWLALAALVLGLFQYDILSLQWVIPWTSSLAATLGMVALVSFHHFLVRRHQAQWSTRARVQNAALCAGMIGLMAPTRPVDCVAFSPVLMVYALLVVRDWVTDGKGAGRAGFLVIATGIVCAVLPGLAYLGFNTWLFGAPISGYFDFVKDHGGAAPQDVWDRGYSHIIDAAAYYGEAGADWLSKLPGLVLALCFLPFSLLLGPMFFRVVSAIIILHMGLVYSYADAVPTGQFRYFNIHYFKWMYPVLPAFGLLLLLQVVRARGSARLRAGGALVGGLAGFCFLMALSPSYTTHLPVRMDIPDPETIVLDFETAVPVNFIDVSSLSTTFSQLDAGAPGLKINGGADLIPVSEFRRMPRPGGVRILLTDTTLVKTVELTMTRMGDVSQAKNLKAQAGEVQFRLQPPWLPEPALPELPVPTIDPGTTYRAGSNGTGDANIYFGSGWSEPETWGRWMDGGSAWLRFTLPKETPPTAHLVIEGQGFVVEQQQPLVSVDVLINGLQAGTIELANPAIGRFVFPLPQERNETPVTLELRPETMLRPARTGMNHDTRSLSFGLVTFQIQP